jgi:flagellar assembly protein FliH
VILRGAQLTDQRFALIPTHSERVTTAEQTVRPLSAKESKAEAVGDGKRMLAIAPGPAVEESKERELSFEKVVAWLAVQDEETRKACASILASDITHIYETAKSEGFAAGQKTGVEAAQKSAAAETKILRELTQAAELAYAHDQEQLQAMCVDVVAEALAKVAGPLLASELAAVGSVEEILARVKEGRELTIRVARDDVPVIRKFEGELREALQGRKFEIVADSRVELGGCIVETNTGSLDGRFEVQLRELYETLRLAKLSAREGM